MKKPIVIIGVVALLMLAAGLGGGLYLSKAGLLPFMGSGGDEAEQEFAEDEPAGLVTMETFLTNVRGPSGSHHVRVNVQLAIAPEERAAEMQEDKLMMARLRDQILTLISAKSMEELSSGEGKQSLRRQIQERLGGMVKQGKVREVLFLDFVVQ